MATRYSNMRNTIFLGFILVFCVLGCLDEKIIDQTLIDDQLLETIDEASITGSHSHFILPNDGEYSLIPNQDPANPISKIKIDLGKMMFFETGFALDPFDPSAKGTYSCASCHIPEAGFTPGRFQGIADGGIGFGFNGEMRRKSEVYGEYDIDAQGLRALSVLNVAYVTNTLWSGEFGGDDLNVGTEDVWDKKPGSSLNALGYKALETQNIRNFGLHRMIINKQVLDSLGYTEMFDQALPELDPEDRYSELGGSFAISSYLRSLITNQAPFQKYLKGNLGAMSIQEKRGAKIFFGKANCASCHSGPALNENKFISVGVKDLYEIQSALGTEESDVKNLGRFGFTALERDAYKFKVPQLYNLRDAHFYFHGSSKNTLKEVVEYFNDGIAENPNIPTNQLSPNFQPLNLTDSEIDDLVSFLKNGLYDASFDRFVPDEVLSGNCFPNNDEISRQDIGCN